jgi:diguanylate cyclase (GGDEF)-like protein/PAS domain S-box-containing protein
MGAAISGMHYTGMAAARFQMDGSHAALPSGLQALQPGGIAVAVVFATVTLLFLAWITAMFDRKLAKLTAHEAEALRKSEERYRSLIENASDIIAIIDRKATFVYESSSASKVLGYSTAQLIGKTLFELAPEDRADDITELLQRVVDRPGEPESAEVPLLHSAGVWRDFEVVAKNLVGDPTIGGIVVNMRDITVRKQLMAQLEALSETDLLTGALNRRGFMKLASREFERTRRAGRKLALVMFDIDHFKAVNDRFGHAAGDLVLAMATEECRRQIRDVDLLGRIGGEEFAIVLVDGWVNAAEDVLARLREAIARQKVSTIKGDVSITASFGMAVVDPGMVDVEVALRLADEALYEAKNAGRNCIRIRA